MEKDFFLLKEVSFIKDLNNTDLQIQIRYNSETTPCSVVVLPNDSLEVKLSTPTTGVSPGQFGVLYSGTKLIGGGRIETSEKERILN